MTLRNTEYREGPSRISVPVCKHPRDFMFTFGPLGYEHVEAVKECPILVEPPEKHQSEQEVMF